jgi:hypothetical protein
LLVSGCESGRKGGVSGRGHFTREKRGIVNDGLSKFGGKIVELGLA